MGKLIKGLHHVALKCDSTELFEETVKFYTELLGMELYRKWGEGAGAGAMIATGTGVIEVFAQGRACDSTGSVNHLALATDDVDACINAVRRAGYPITVEPRDIVIPSEPALPARIGFCIGPVGEEIEFFYEK